MKMKNLRWAIIMLIAVATVINYIDRTAFGVMWPEISKDLNIDKADYGLILNAFMLAYAFGQSAFGKIFDAIGVRLGFIVAIIVWSVGTCLHALASSASSLLAFRVILGFGEAGPWPGATKSNAEWFPVKERALAQGIFNSGAAIGNIVSAPLIWVLFSAFGWKATFLIVGGVGFLWIIPWMILYKSGPETHPWLTDEERDYILKGKNSSEGEAKEEYVPSWFSLLKFRQTWSVLGARFFIEPIWWLFVGWLPIYLFEKFNFQVKDIGMFGWMPYVGAAAGALFGGWLSGVLLRRGVSVGLVRKGVVTLGVAFILPSMIFASSASSPALAIALITLVLFGFQTAIGSIQTLPSDFFSGKTVGSVAGLGGTVGLISVMAVNFLVPVMTEGGNYVSVFILGAAFMPFLLFFVWVVAGRVETVRKES